VLRQHLLSFTGADATEKFEGTSGGTDADAVFLFHPFPVCRYCPTPVSRTAQRKTDSHLQKLDATMYSWSGSSCRDKHNRPRCDSNLDPLTPQSDALTTRLLRSANQCTSMHPAMLAFASGASTMKTFVLHRISRHPKSPATAAMSNESL